MKDGSLHDWPGAPLQVLSYLGQLLAVGQSYGLQLQCFTSTSTATTQVNCLNSQHCALQETGRNSRGHSKSSDPVQALVRSIGSGFLAQWASMDAKQQYSIQDDPMPMELFLARCSSQTRLHCDAQPCLLISLLAECALFIQASKCSLLQVPVHQPPQRSTSGILGRLHPADPAPGPVSSGAPAASSGTAASTQPGVAGGMCCTRGTCPSCWDGRA